MQKKEKEEIINKNYACAEVLYIRHGKCTECQAYHHKHKEKTHCGK